MRSDRLDILGLLDAVICHIRHYHPWLEYPCLILQVVRSQGTAASTGSLSAIDYFGTRQTNGPQSSFVKQGEEDDDGDDHEVGNECEEFGARGKRKKKNVEKDVRTKKKRNGKNPGAEGNESVYLLHVAGVDSLSLFISAVYVGHAAFSVSEGGGGQLKEGEGNGISWTSSLDREIQNLPDDGKEKYSLKRLKHLHQEKVCDKQKSHHICWCNI